jgi:RNA polymerase sigma-54 factor
MALSAKLAMRQGQTMVLTPQLLQAIKLLQMPNLELTQFIENELTSNPLLERAEEREDSHSEPLDGPGPPAAADAPAEPGDWAGEALETDAAGLAANLGTEVDNAFDSDRTAPAIKAAPADGLSAHAWTGLGVGSDAAEAPDLEAYVAEALTLRDYLERQAAILLADPAERIIGAALIDALDEAGYFVGSLADIADRLAASVERVERVLMRMQVLEPTGVFARSLAECLALQLKERDRFDPAMQAMIENLPALAKRDFPLLRRVCGVDDEDLRDMIAEIRRLEPKPGRAFGDPPAAPAIPDVHVTAAPDFGWRVELNTRALPRVLVNEVYAAEIRRGAKRDEDRQYVSTQLQAANWLTKSLEQRARTILNVASEIVRRQDSFLLEGVSGLRPLNGLARDRPQVHSDASRPVRDEVFLHRRNRLERTGPGSFGRSRAPANPADDRRREPGRGAVRRPDRRAPSQGGHPGRSPHRGQISRQPENPFVGRATQDEDGADARQGRTRQFPRG